MSRLASETHRKTERRLPRPAPPVVALLASLLLTSGLAAAQSSKPGSENALETLDLGKFSRPTVISNKWLPMKVGTRWIYEGTTVEDDGKVVPHRLEIAVTDLVKNIAGVCNVVSYDLDYSDGELAEAELAFFAQDDDGNVWHFGQYPEEYEDEKFSRAPTWIHGFEQAQAGIMMQAEPRLGRPSYAQGWGPAVDWTDRGRVHQMGVEVSGPAGSFKDVLVIGETSRAEVDALHLKYYASGIGNVRVGWAGQGEKTQETLELTKVEQLSPKDMAEIRAKALELEASGYQKSKNVYALTQPATQYKPGGNCQ